MSDEPKTTAEDTALTDGRDQEASEKAERSGKKINRLSKKNKLLTDGVKKVVGGRGGWDGNHNEILI